MKQMKFRTSIKCTGCLNKVTPYLNDTRGIENWDLDLKNPEKVLTINASEASEEDVIQTVKKLGYEIEQIDKA
ncbi:MAG: cation transporter [Bacteroidota bacterium]|nr:cation transporter [Bacteroidota bacterium]MDX5430345.1 cation transporter [Bacteroidota bacterium]MDX5469106.1 cation transporter [Bacteroidota bacterium]